MVRKLVSVLRSEIGLGPATRVVVPRLLARLTLTKSWRAVVGRSVMLRVLRSGVLLRDVLVLRARRELSGSALRRSGTPEPVRRTFEGTGVLLREEGAG